jgi:hypothetical protein
MAYLGTEEDEDRYAKPLSRKLRRPLELSSPARNSKDLHPSLQSQRTHSDIAT